MADCITKTEYLRYIQRGMNFEGNVRMPDGQMFFVQQEVINQEFISEEEARSTGLLRRWGLHTINALSTTVQYTHPVQRSGSYYTAKGRLRPITGGVSRNVWGDVIPKYNRHIHSQHTRWALNNMRNWQMFSRFLFSLNVGMEVYNVIITEIGDSDLSRAEKNANLWRAGANVTFAIIGRAGLYGALISITYFTVHIAFADEETGRGGWEVVGEETANIARYKRDRIRRFSLNDLNNLFGISFPFSLSIP